MIQGVIVKGIGGFYYVQTEKGLYECRARGIFRKDKAKPAVGDSVQISILDEKNKKGSLDVLEARRSMLLRPRVANVNQAVVVFSAVSPQLNVDLLDRFLILAKEQNLDIIICINKVDLDTERNFEAVAGVYKKAGFTVLCISACTGLGIEALQFLLKGRISVFAGPSGVGKSSIINRITPHAAMETGEISQKISRGRHTTRHAELIAIDEDSFLVDSPGFTSLDLEHIAKENLQYYYPEFAPLLAKCHYGMCSHTHEPNCAVKAQVGQAVDTERHQRYVSIYQQINDIKKDWRK